jgi:hypothetical protein
MWSGGTPEAGRAAVSLIAGLRSLVDDALDLAAVDVEFAGYGALAVPGVVPGPYRLLHAWRFGQREWCVVVLDSHGVVHGDRGGRRGTGSALPSDEGHQEFERAGERQGWPCADQGSDGAVAEAVRQVGADGGGDPGAKAPACQGWYGLVAAVGVEDEHAGGEDQAVDGEWGGVGR